MHGSSWATQIGITMERLMLLLLLLLRLGLLLLLLKGVMGWVHATRMGNLQKKKNKEKGRSKNDISDYYETVSAYRETECVPKSKSFTCVKSVV